MVPRRSLTILTLAACGVLLAGRAGLADLDICGCINSPKSLGAFDTLTRSGYPPGTIDNFRSIVIPVPADGVLVFNSMNVASRPEEGCCLTVSFARNAANTPLTILVSGDVNIVGPSVTVNLSADSGGGGSNGGAGAAGLGGPGGFRGGDGAYQQTNGASDGGAGLGPTGGAPGVASVPSRGGDGTFFGLKELLPLVGGAGGGGGASFAGQVNCAGGGGGGGGGALLIAANGTITIKSSSIAADGGNAGGESNGGCATRSGAGSGGAIRLVAKTIAGPDGLLYARGGLVDCCTRTGGPGVIRLEAVTNTLPAANTDPPASRAAAPGPIVNPFAPTVAITAVGGQPVPAPATGNSGGIDVFVPVPGPTEIDVATSGVPSGTTLQVNVKPRVGGSVVTLNAPISSCDSAGNCLIAVTPTLASGAYIVEARATFQTP